MKSNRKLLRIAVMFLLFGCLAMRSQTVSATEVEECLSPLKAGAAVILDADITLDTAELETIAIEATKTEEKQEPDSTLAMANVKESMNIRQEADEDSRRVGVLYKDCGGDIVEQKDGWTKIRSGDVEGWAKDEYLFFGDEAESVAQEVGNLVAKADKLDSEALRVRKAADENAETWGAMATNDEVIALEEMGEWVSVDFNGEIGYVSSNYVSVKFKIDAGETAQVIEARAKKEAEEKEKAAQEKAKQQSTVTENRGAVPEAFSEAQLLAALIQCEAGGESYEGQVAVGAVVMNRLRSGGYPSSVQGVIYASGQFTPAMNGKVDRVASSGAKASCVQAAQEAISGVSNVGSATHFKRAGAHDGLIIGNHVFW